jgi:hypothetical protein
MLRMRVSGCRWANDTAFDRQRSGAYADHQAMSENRGASSRSCDTPITVPPRRAFLRAPPASPFDFLNVAVFGLRGKDCRSAVAGRIWEFEGSGSCSQTFTAANGRVRGPAHANPTRGWLLAVRVVFHYLDAHADLGTDRRLCFVEVF